MGTSENMKRDAPLGFLREGDSTAYMPPMGLRAFGIFPLLAIALVMIASTHNTLRQDGDTGE